MNPTNERNGSSRARPMPRRGLIDEYLFWRKVQRSGPDDCWPWTAAATERGYGRVKVDGVLYSSHRIAYYLANGSIPDDPAYHGLMVMHRCDNPACCNPRHLTLGTAGDNAKDMAAKGRNFQPMPPRREPWKKHGLTRSTWQRRVSAGLIAREIVSPSQAGATR